MKKAERKDPVGGRWRLDPGPYAFGERAEVRLHGDGDKVFLWVGIASRAGQPGLDSCLGVLPAHFSEQLANAILRRLALGRKPRSGK